MFDLVKGVGRGFKWIFIGRKRREQDISYKNHIVHAGSASDGNSVGIPGLRSASSKYTQLGDEGAEDTRPLTHGRRGKADDDIDDAFSEQPSREEREDYGSHPFVSSPYSAPSHAPSSTQYAPPSFYSSSPYAGQEAGTVDTEYHGGAGGAAISDSRDAMRAFGQGPGEGGRF